MMSRVTVSEEESGDSGGFFGTLLIVLGVVVAAILLVAFGIGIWQAVDSRHELQNNINNDWGTRMNGSCVVEWGKWTPDTKCGYQNKCIHDARFTRKVTKVIAAKDSSKCSAKVESVHCDHCGDDVKKLNQLLWSRWTGCRNHTQYRQRTNKEGQIVQPNFHSSNTEKVFQMIVNYSFEWTNTPEGAAKQFRREWFQGDSMVRRKNLPIEYNP